MDAKRIAGLLSLSRFHFRRYLLVSNVSWGLLPWEADLIAMTSSGYLHEVEIKISIADLKRDPKKAKWRGGWEHYHRLVKSRWFAMPEKVWQHKDAVGCVPDGAGVITVREPRSQWDSGVEVAREAIENKDARALTETEQFQLARLQAMRHWSKLAREARKAA